MSSSVRPVELTPASEASSEPRVWLVTGYRAGERSQILALAEALGWPFDIKELSYRRCAARVSLFRGRDIRGIRTDQSSLLEPPWPDLVISAGMRNEPVCRWIREQSGGRARLVHIGRPWAPLEQFDLVITTPQYRLPARANVLQNTATLHRITAQRLQAEARIWRPRFDTLPRPHIAVIVGGNSGPCTFGRKAARRLATQAGALARARGGSLLVSTSARTPLRAAQELSERIDVPMHFYRWRPDDETNPYYGYLALADAIIVTADSIAMLTEACATGKPVYMFDPGVGGQALSAVSAPDSEGNDFRLSAWLYRWLMRWGPRRLSRDISLVHRRLIEGGQAVWLGEPFSERPPLPLKDLERAVQRVRRLMGAGVSAPGGVR